jgi:hypothetical protein
VSLSLVLAGALAATLSRRSRVVFLEGLLYAVYAETQGKAILVRLESGLMQIHHPAAASTQPVKDYPPRYRLVSPSIVLSWECSDRMNHTALVFASPSPGQAAASTRIDTTRSAALKGERRLSTATITTTQMVLAAARRWWRRVVLGCGIVAPAWWIAMDAVSKRIRALFSLALTTGRAYTRSYRTSCRCVRPTTACESHQRSHADQGICQRSATA